MVLKHALLKFQNQKNIVIGCIYRHPSSKLEHFHDILKEKLEYISRSGFETYVAEDVNIDFLKYATDKKTSYYLDMLFSLGFMPLITKATRITHHSKTLIDHIYTNAPEKIINTRICLADISRHLISHDSLQENTTIENIVQAPHFFAQRNNNNNNIYSFLI